MLRDSQLRGFDIPGLEQRLITTLFADDTTVYLSELDSYHDLQRILSTWCLASGARFNVSKTEVIPIGSPAYRHSLISSRKLHSTAEPIPDDIRIAPDGTLTRILGAWIGNSTDRSGPWAPVVASIKARLADWDKPGLTMPGRRLIVNMEVGGRIQFLTKVQGMPKSVLSDLERTIRSFMWKGASHPPINLETLYRPIDLGGLGLMDISARVKNGSV
ncbi:hypothetical protein BDW22DRAFT_1407806 [Trametopsis cervina]|nr:hypothetical protein BDW22DRAFT_1407806 [Trametopsis cervina]